MSSVGFDSSQIEGICVARLDGEIDLANATIVGDQLREVAADAVALVVDLSQVRYVDSGGIRMLFQVAEHLSTSRRHLAVAVPEQSPLSRLVKITRLDEAAVLATTVEACVDALADRS